ncbi:hypothetical protein GQ53DRAFT_836843 [Thozetella sp. PMI_491]|nr:hypothetical protein GQ53DRAFT_836843 [Thozetella sp. PMI_491]
MAEALAVVGGLAAGLQLVQQAAQALLGTIKLLKDLQEVPDRLAILLDDVDSSISRLCCICDASSKTFHSLQMDLISRSANALYPALQDIHDMLNPLVGSPRARGWPVRRLWKALVSLKIEQEMSAKLQRLNRLNLDLIRELGMVGLEVQVASQGLILAANAASSQGFADIRTQMDDLRSNFQNLSFAVRRAHAVSGEEGDRLSEYLNTGFQDPYPRIGGASYGIRGRPISISGSTEYSHDASGGVPEERLSKERAEQMRSYLFRRPEAAAPTLGLRIMLDTQPPNATLEFLLYSIRTFYTPGNFDTAPLLRKSEFWKDTNLAVYLMKVSKSAQRGTSQSEARGLAILRKSTATAHAVLDQSTSTIIIELLSTLSPVNTSACLYVREGLLRYLSELAREQLPREHPIALVINRLKDDNGDKDVTLRALRFVAERLAATLGPVHELTLLAYKRLCALLRRGGELTEAIAVCEDELRAIRANLGASSLQERTMARALEHIYIEQCDWPAALSVCFEIVGQRIDASAPPNPDPRFHDSCAVYTMEDIAKICECAGNVEQAIAWLKQARISGGMAFGPSGDLAHVQDKLNELLRLSGNEEDIAMWSGLSHMTGEAA